MINIYVGPDTMRKYINSILLVPFRKDNLYSYSEKEKITPDPEKRLFFAVPANVDDSTEETVMQQDTLPKSFKAFNELYRIAFNPCAVEYYEDPQEDDFTLDSITVFTEVYKLDKEASNWVRIGKTALRELELFKERQDIPSIAERFFSHFGGSKDKSLVS